MPRTFSALCRINDALTVRRIPLKAGLQGELEQMFDRQEQDFLNGRDEEIDFNGDWKPDPNQLMVIDDGPLLQVFNHTIEVGPAAFEHLDVTDHQAAGIKAIFTHSATQEGRILIQRFQASQYLQRSGLTLVFNDNLYGKLSDPGFSLDTRLTAIVEGSLIKFPSFRNLRTILTIQEHFNVATQAELDVFVAEEVLYVENRALFDAAMDERARKLVRGIQRSGVLTNFDVPTIRAKAGEVGLMIDERDGKIVMPGDKRRLKTILGFLEESVYKGVFSDETYETNSKRTVNL